MVIKKSLLKKDDDDNDNDLDFFYREFQMAFELQDVFGGGVVSVHQCAYSERAFYFSQEKLYGALEGDLVRALHQQTMIERLEKLYDLLLTLIYIHERGVVHGDIKPENLMSIDAEVSKIKMIDFGLAFKYPKKVRNGTPLYMSPGFIFGSRYNNIADDYFALLMSIFVIEFGSKHLNKYHQCITYFQSWGIHKKLEKMNSEEKKARAADCNLLLKVAIENAFKDKKDDFVMACGEESFKAYQRFFQKMTDPEFFKTETISQDLEDFMLSVLGRCNGHLCRALNALEELPRLTETIILESNEIDKIKESLVVKLSKDHENELRQAQEELKQDPSKLAEEPSQDINSKNRKELAQKLPEEPNQKFDEDDEEVERKVQATKEFIEARRELYEQKYTSKAIQANDQNQKSKQKLEFSFGINFNRPLNEILGDLKCEIKKKPFPKEHLIV